MAITKHLVKKINTYDLQQISESEEDYLAYWVANKLFNSSAGEEGTISDISLNGTSIGSYTDTFFNQAVGTHPGSSITSSSTVTTLYQNFSGNATLPSVDPVTLVDGETDLKATTSSDLNVIADRLLEKVFGSDYFSYQIGTSAPSGHTIFISSLFTDTRTDGTSITYNLYKKNLPSVPTKIQPVKLFGSDLKIMTDNEIRDLFGQAVKNRIASGGIGSYVLRSATQGAPTATGTWVSRGTAIDTKQNVADENYTRNSQRTSTRNSTRGTSGQFLRTSTRAFTRESGATYLGNYVGSAQFVGNYAGNYASGPTNIAGTYVGNYTANFVRTSTLNFTRDSTVGYSRTSTVNYARTSTRSSTRAFAGNFIGNYITAFVRNSTVAYTRNSTRVRDGGDFTRTSVVVTPPRVGGTYGGRTEYYGGGTSYYVGNYVGGNFTRTSVVTTGRSGGTYGGVTQYYAGTTSYYVGNYTGNFIGNYTGNFIGGNFLGEYTHTYTRTSTRSSTRAFAGNYVGNYTGDFIGNYQGNFIGNYTGNFVGNYANTFAGEYTSDDYIGDYAGNYVTEQDFIGNYSAGFLGEYTAEYVGNYDGGFVGNYDGNFIGDYTGDYLGQTIQVTSSQAEIYTLYLRVS